VTGLLSAPFVSYGQRLVPGFSAGEYIELMKISARTGIPESYSENIPEPSRHIKLYESETLGLDHLWSLWINDSGTIGVISIRGTTEKSESWLANFYAAMVPAQDEIHWTDGKVFEYELSSDPKATVHAGWLVGMAFLAGEIIPRIDSLHHRGVKDFVIIGHSQGGGLAYLLNAHLHRLIKQGSLPGDIQLKTYCSASPKPGNLFFAYTYEAMTQNGWAYNVVNAMDWVPELPFSIQTFDDFNPTNPFIHATDMIKQQKFPQNIALRHIYNKLDKPTRKAQRRYSKYLGSLISKFVSKQIEGLVLPDYAPTFNYVRTGTTIVLTPDDGYLELFPDDNTKIFAHHFHPQYLYLASRLGKPFYEND
jgi:hypothetical protein